MCNSFGEECIFECHLLIMCKLPGIIYERSSLPSKNFLLISMDMLQIGALSLVGRLVEPCCLHIPIIWDVSTGSGPVKYKENPLASKLLGNSAWEICLLLPLIFISVYLNV